MSLDEEQRCADTRGDEVNIYRQQRGCLFGKIKKIQSFSTMHTCLIVQVCQVKDCRNSHFFCSNLQINSHFSGEFNEDSEYLGSTRISKVAWFENK